MENRSDLSKESLAALLNIAWIVKDVPGDIAEVGAYRCGTTIELAKANPHKLVYAFDVFGGLPYGDKQQGYENFADADFEEICEATKPYPNIKLIQGRHEQTLEKFWKEMHLSRLPNPASLSLIFMDSDFYSSHREALSWLYPLLSPEGYVVFHDWVLDGVQCAIRDFTVKFGHTRNDEPGRIGFTLPDAPNMGAIQKAS